MVDGWNDCGRRTLRKLFINLLSAGVNRKPSDQCIQIIRTELVSHLNIYNSETYDTHTWTSKQRCDQVPASRKHHICMRDWIILCVYVCGGSIKIISIKDTYQ